MRLVTGCLSAFTIAFASFASAAQSEVMTFSGIAFPYTSATYVEDGILAVSDTGGFSPSYGGIAIGYLKTVTFSAPGHTFDLASFNVYNPLHGNFQSYPAGARVTGFDGAGHVVAATGPVWFNTGLYTFADFIGLTRLEIRGDLGTGESPSEALTIDNLRFSISPTAGVPEPGAWALLLAGFVGIGSALRRPQRRRRLAPSILGLIFAILMAAPAANAAVVASVSGNTGLSYRIGGPNHQVETMSWSQTSAFSGVSIFATVGALDGAGAEVKAYLSTDLGASAGPVLESATVWVNPYASVAGFASVKFFDGLTLGPGTYSLTLYSSDETRFVRWARGDNADFIASAQAAGEYFANNGEGVPDPAAPWKSTFIVSPNYDKAFSVETSAAPEPGAWALMILGFAAAGSAIRGRRRAGLTGRL